MTRVVCLSVKSGPLEGHKYFVKTDSSILIGRNEQANIRIDDEFCSRKHALVFWENDTCYIQDLNSTNGVCVNHVRIEGKSKLNNRDVINFGNTEVVVLMGEPKNKDEENKLQNSPIVQCMSQPLGNLRTILLVAACTLFLAIIPIWPYVFYTLLRLFVCGFIAYVAYKIRNEERLKPHKIPLIIMAVLFNPLFPIYLVRLIWFPIDVGIGIYLLNLRSKI